MNWATLLTAPGPAAIAVVRVGGPGLADFLRRHFSRPAAVGRAVHGNLIDGERVIDDPVVVLHEGRASADINVHGGAWVVREMLELARRSGFEVIPAARVPLPDQAVDGDDEITRRIHRLLPLARTELALRWLLSQPNAWRRRSVSIAPAMEFPRALLYPPKIAIVGAANVGKSTLANQLFGRDRSITADVPGTTRDWVGEIAEMNGVAVFLMDTPGMRVTSDPIEQAAIAASSGEIAGAELVILVVDARESVEEQREWVEQFPRALVVRNKCDLIKAEDPHPNPVPEYRARGAEGSEAWPHVYTVGTTGQGIAALRKAIVRPFIRPWRAAAAGGYP